MTLRTGFLAAVFAAFAVPAAAVPVTWTIQQGTGDGSASVSTPAGLDLKIDIVGSDRGSFRTVKTMVTFVYEGMSSFLFKGNWTYSTIDSPAFDILGYFNGGVSADLTSYFWWEDQQSGEVAFTVNPGTVFGFFIESVDDMGGRAVASITVDEGVFPMVAPPPGPVVDPGPGPSPVPLPAGAALLLPAVGLLGFVRRRRGGAA